VNAIIVFPDAGPAMLPAIRDAHKQGSAVIPFRAEVGGKEGSDYNAFVGTDFYIQGKTWGDWLVTALKDGGNVAYLGGPPGTSESTDKSRGLHDAFKDHPDIKWIGQDPFEVTNWDPSLISKALTALIARYPKVDAVVADLSIPILTSNAFPRAGKELPVIAGEDANGFGCEWQKEHADGKQSNYQFTSTSAEQWNSRLAVRWAIAEAAGGKVRRAVDYRRQQGRQASGRRTGRQDRPHLCDGRFPQGRRVLRSVSAGIGWQRNGAHQRAIAVCAQGRSLNVPLD
jgi:ribose transport system substrate-binding protein